MITRSQCRGSGPVAEVPQDRHHVAVGIASGAGEEDRLSGGHGEIFVIITLIFAIIVPILAIILGGDDSAVRRVILRSLRHDLAADLPFRVRFGVDVDVEVAVAEVGDESVPVA
jgi:hypothetical protein